MTESQPHAPLITIDPRGSRDLDDAIAVERRGDTWEVTVAIADVAGAVRWDSPEDREARARAATRYFGTGNSPMLPRDFERAASLLPHHSRWAMLLNVRLDAALERLRLAITREEIRTVSQLAYDEVPGILADTTHRLHPMLSAAATLATGLLERRRARGALALYDLNAGWLTTEDGQLKVLDRREDTIGQVIVQELMILANVAVADLAISADWPLLWRNHQARPAAPPRDELLRAIEDARLAPTPAIEHLRERTHLLLDRATYGATTQGHYGLNLAAYLHFTSPIRRYADLLNHHQVRAQLRGEPLPVSREQLAAIAQELNDRADEARAATSAHFKAKAEDQARDQIAARRLDGVSAKQFERAVKVELAAGAGPSAALAEAYAFRLRQGAVPLICQALVLAQGVDAAWASLQQATLAAMAAQLPDAVSALTQLQQIEGWPAADFAESGTGQAHERTFTSFARFEQEGRLIEATGIDRSTKRARYRAALALLAGWCGLAAPDGRYAQPSERQPTDADYEALGAVIEQNPLGVGRGCNLCAEKDAQLAARDTRIAELEAECDRLAQQLADARSYILADEERRKLTGDVLQAEAERDQVRQRLTEMEDNRDRLAVDYANADSDRAHYKLERDRLAARVGELERAFNDHRPIACDRCGAKDTLYVCGGCHAQMAKEECGEPAGGARTVDGDETAWLIELGQAQGYVPPLWWRGQVTGPDARGLNTREFWTENATEARKFATKREAERTAYWLAPHVQYAVTEHVFLAKAPPTPAPAQGEGE